MNPNISTLKTQVNALHGVISAKITERQDLTAEIEAVNSTPPDRQAILELLHGYVDEQAGLYGDELQSQVAPYVEKWQKADYLKKSGFALLSARENPGADIKVSPHNQNGIFFLLKTPIKTALAQAISAMELPAGISNSERQQRLKGLTARLTALDTELSALYEECQGLGITLPDATLSAAEKETRRRAALAADRAAREPATRIVELPGDRDDSRKKRNTSESFSITDIPEGAFADPDKHP